MKGTLGIPPTARNTGKARCLRKRAGVDDVDGGRRVIDELRLAAAALMLSPRPPSAEQRQHALKHARTASLLLASPTDAPIVGACGLPSCYESAPKVSPA